MTSLGIFKLFNMPVVKKLCSALASGFNNVSQVICEFIDNSVSNLMGHPDDASLVRTIRIVICNLQNFVDVMIEDGGTGIEDMNTAFTLCGTGCGNTPLNASGCGFKNGFAYLESSGGSWTCSTRTKEDVTKNRYKFLRGPYDFGLGTLSGEYLPGWIGTLGETGTMIALKCPKSVFATVCPTATEEEPKFHDLVALLKEHLRYTYADLLADGTVNMELIVEDGLHIKKDSLMPLTPTWDTETWKEIPPKPVNLGGGDLEIHCQYGDIIGNEDNLYYYRGNMESSGAEICINGRVIESGLLKRIWGRKVHPSQNAFLVRVNLVTDSLNAIPMTKAAKSGFREEDPRLKKLFLWIRANVALSEHVWESREKKLLRKLAEKLGMQSETTRVTREMPVFCNLGLNVRADILQVDNDVSRVYEGKLQNTRAANLYQLRMYWDGAVQDGLPPQEGILIGAHHPEEVHALLAYMNKQLGPDGRPYNFRLATWQEEGIALA